jgi:sRNA-binding regulator protein Hfq
VANRNTSGGAFRTENEAPSNRKLIRPSLSELADRYPTRTFQQRKQVPPEQTNAESYYYLKQMAAKTPMVVVLNDGEEIRGWIEWYDKNCLKVNRDRGPNLLIPKTSIKYLFKQDEDFPRGGNR